MKIKFSTNSIKNFLTNATIANSAVEPQTQQVKQLIIPARKAPPPPTTNTTEQQEAITISDSDSFYSANEEIPAINRPIVSWMNKTENSDTPTEVNLTSSTQDFSDDSLFEMEINSSEKVAQDLR